MMIREPLELQRLRYWQGQMLRSRDLRDQVATEAQLRWWHNRALHNAFGVASGFEVTRRVKAELNGQIVAVELSDQSVKIELNDQSVEVKLNKQLEVELNGQTVMVKLNGQTVMVQLNDQAVVVNLSDQPVIVYPGIAYDCFGRELILAQPYSAPVPPEDIDSKEWKLLARYRETDEFPRRNEIASVCLLGTAPGLAEQPVFSWKESDQVEIRDGVPLARFVNGELCLAVRLTRPLARPRIANGATIPGNTAWGIWKIEGPDRVPIIMGLEVEIDTRAAGFTDTPCYFAWLHGTLGHQQLAQRLTAHLKQGSESIIARLVLSTLLLQVLANRFGHIHVPAANGFTFRLWLPQLAKWVRLRQEMNIGNFLAIAQELQLSVCWLGIQPDEHLSEVNHGTA